MRRALNATFLPSRQANDTASMYAAKAYMSLAIHILSRTGRGGAGAVRRIVGPYHQVADGGIVIMSPHDVMIGGT